MSTLPENPDSPPATLFSRLDAFKRRNERLLSTAFFLGGFLFDAIMLSRIDEPLMLVQQGVYLLVCGALLAISQLLELKKTEPPAWLRKPWQYADPLLTPGAGRPLCALQHLPDFLLRLFDSGDQRRSAAVDVLPGGDRRERFVVRSSLLPVALGQELPARRAARGHSCFRRAGALRSSLYAADRAAGAARYQADRHLSPGEAGAGRLGVVAADQDLEVLAASRCRLSRTPGRQAVLLRAH